MLTSTTASLSHTVASSSSSTTSIHGPGGQSTRSSNTRVIAGGTVAGVVAISIAAVVSFRYGRKRRSSLGQPAPSSDDGQAGGYNPWPMSGQEIITPSLPSPTIPLLRQYVRSYAFIPVALVCSCAFSHFLTRRTRMTQLRSPGTKEIRARLSSLLKHLSCLTIDMHIPLPPHRFPKCRDNKADYFSGLSL